MNYIFDKRISLSQGNNMLAPELLYKGKSSISEQVAPNTTGTHPFTLYPHNHKPYMHLYLYDTRLETAILIVAIVFHIQRRRQAMCLA